MSIGIDSRAKADKGFIVISDWRIESEWALHNVYAKKVGQKLKGKTIKPNTWYWFENGVLMESEDES